MGMREDYQVLMEKQLHQWNAQAERFKAGAEQMEVQAKAQYEKNLEFLRAKQKAGWERFGKLKNASEGAWSDFKADMDKAGEEIKSAAERLTAQVKK